MELKNNKNIVMTLDAGGTNFVFSAIQGNEEIVKPISFCSFGNDLDKCLKTIIDGFTIIKNSLPAEPVAISFAFPGPADYPNGIIGDLPNMSAFRGGVALGPLLQELFHLPVFINNDGDLFAYGEASCGFLPYVNNLLKNSHSDKRYHNLVGITLGTGFGCGIVRNNELFIGDNSTAAEIWLMRSKLFPFSYVEQSVGIQAVKDVYSELANSFDDNLTPKDIFEISKELKSGNREAAKESFRRLGESVGDALANAVTLIDGLIVIGGGISGANEMFLPAVLKEMNSNYRSLTGELIPRLVFKVFNLDDGEQLEIFLKGSEKEIFIPYSQKKIKYDSMSRIGIGISKLGTTKAISIGAYAFALKKLNLLY